MQAKGAATLISFVQHFSGHCRYKPRAGNAKITLPYLAPCTFAPSEVPIDPENGGLLEVDYSTTPPTYTGYGKSIVAITISCPEFASLPFNDLALYLGMLGRGAEGRLKNGLIEGTQEEGFATVTWKYQGCIPTVTVFDAEKDWKNRC